MQLELINAPLWRRSSGLRMLRDALAQGSSPAANPWPSLFVPPLPGLAGAAPAAAVRSSSSCRGVNSPKTPPPSPGAAAGGAAPL